MKRSISIIGSILLAAALTSPAWANPGKGKGGGQSGSGGSGGESQAGGLPGLEDRVEADEALIATLQTQVSTLMGDITVLQGQVSTLQGQVSTLTTDVTTLQGQNNFAVVGETATTCTLLASNSSAGPVTATFISDGVCQVTYSKDVALCSSVASIVGVPSGEISVTPSTKTVAGDSVTVSTFIPAGTPSFSGFNLTTTCP
jgi:TolA-binding protein